MLSDTAKLYFPKLSFEKSVIINDSNGTAKNVSLYNLDWTRKENKCAEDKYTGLELTVEYETKIKSLRFAVPDAYIKEIRRMSRSAVAEWNELRLLDESIKKIYLQPAGSYIETAFTLLMDCLYDESTKYYYRKNDKEFILAIMLYKFWRNQTKTALIMKFSKFNQLMDVMRNVPELESEISRFIEYVKYDLKVESNGTI